MRVFLFAVAPVALEPRFKIFQGDFPPLWHLDALQQLPEGEKLYVLVVIVVVVRVVKVAGALYQKWRVADIKHITRRLLHFLKGQGGFAAAGAANDDQWWEQVEDCLLVVVKGDDFIEQVKVFVCRIDVG